MDPPEIPDNPELTTEEKALVKKAADEIFQAELAKVLARQPRRRRRKADDEMAFAE